MPVLLAVVVLIGVVIGVAAGPRALLVYAFFAGVPAAVGFALWVGGRWLQDASSGRFRRGRD